MNPISCPPDILARFHSGSEAPLAPEPEFYQTANGYWIAWQPETAAVLPPHLPEGEPCDCIEGMDSPAELAALIESGEYEALLAEEDGAETSEHTCGCGCAHGKGSLKT